MPRSALILSCAIHGSVLALVGWSSLWMSSRPEPARTEMSVSLSSGENALVTEEFPAPAPSPEFAVTATPETSFAPPEPSLPPAEVSPTTPETQPPQIPSFTQTPGALPSVSTAKQSHGRRAARVAPRAGSANPVASGTTVGGGGGSGYMPPQFLSRYKPPYPAEARSQRLEGMVLLLVGVDTEGHVTSVRLHQGSGYAILDRAALEAVRNWRFTPARQGDRIIPATVEVPVRFHFSS